jgi:hypothetical protein
MSVNDLINSGIELQGKVEIKEWKNDEEKLYYKGEAENLDQKVYWMSDKTITFMYSIDEVGLIIEIQ